MMDLEKIAEKLVSLQIKYPKKFIWAFIVIVCLLIPGIFNLVSNVEPSLEKVLPQNIDEIKTMNYMRSEFGSDILYLVIYAKGPVHDVRSYEYLRYLDILSSKLSTRDNVLEVTGLNNFVKTSNEGFIPKDKNLLEDFFRKNPSMENFMNDDYSFSMMMVRTNSGSNAQMIEKVITQVENDIETSEEFNPGVEIDITGFSAIDKKTFSVIMSDFLVITFVSMAAVALIVLITFKSLSKGMLPMVIVMNALVMTMGIVGYLSFTITVVSMVASAMIMGLGIDFGIHQVYSYFEERKTHSKKVALKKTMSELLRAMLGASLTTISGFLALLFGVLPAMKTLGVILAIGIFTTLLGAIFLLPVILYLYDSEDKNKNINRG